MKQIFKVKNCSVFVEGQGYLGTVNELDLPMPKTKTDTHQGGGMIGEMEFDMGQEAMEFGIDLSAFSAELLSQFGVGQGQTKIFRFLAAQRDQDGTVQEIESTIEGFLKSVDNVTLKPGDGSSVKANGTVRVMEFKVDGRQIFKIDFNPGGDFIVNGVSQYGAVLQAIGAI